MKINAGYAWAQLVDARHTAADHADPEVRARAALQVAKWEKVIDGMQRGTIDVGSRTPTSAPAWVTLEVVTGGFATGDYSAAGPLADDEIELARRLALPATRRALNLHYLESPEIDELLGSGRYRIDMPEHGALLVVAWLRQRGRIEPARALVSTIMPWFERLRFYPIAAPQPFELRDTVRRQDVRATLDGVARDRRQPRFETMREAVQVWTPLGDRAIGLFAETLAPERDVAHGQLAASFPAGWHDRVAALAADCSRAGTATTARARDAAGLIALLVRLADNPGYLTEAHRRKLRRKLTRHIAAHGWPGSAEHAARRASDARAVAAPLHADLRRIVVERLRALPGDGGLDLAAMAAPVSAGEAHPAVPAGSPLPGYLRAKLARSWDAPLEAIVDHGAIPSSEILARVLPQLTGTVRAQAFDDHDARRLYAAIYGAFRRRRGLLLYNYQHQVAVHELPWVAALEATRRSGPDASAAAREAMTRVSSIAIRAYPQTIFPNKLVRELASLAHAGELKLPLVEELAADIFMGAFTAKFREAARIAGRLLENTLYARYYGIASNELLALRGPTRSPSRHDDLDPDERGAAPAPVAEIAHDFAKLCQRRAGSGGRGVAGNGKIIEQSQILTTHNLAVVFDAFGLREPLAPSLRTLAERCFRWILRKLRLPVRKGHEFLVRVKNAAYAWRQLMFYLSFVDDASSFAAWARRELGRTDIGFQRRFEPAIRGLELALAGAASTSPQFSEAGGRVFTGWTTERHWLSTAPAE